MASINSNKVLAYIERSQAQTLRGTLELDEQEVKQAVADRLAAHGLICESVSLHAIADLDDPQGEAYRQKVIATCVVQKGVERAERLICGPIVPPQEVSHVNLETVASEAKRVESPVVESSVEGPMGPYEEPLARLARGAFAGPADPS